MTVEVAPRGYDFDSTNASGARWYDQKVTFDNLAVVAAAVENLVCLRGIVSFSRFDLADIASLELVLKREYGKPALGDAGAANEYDKFLSQNLNVLAFAGVLASTSGKPRRYEVNQPDLLRRLAGDEAECRKFLLAYLQWVLERFGWWGKFEKYVNSKHAAEDMDALKASFTNLLVDTMGLGSRGARQPEVEAGRIFQKVLNLLAFQYCVPGVERGRVMQENPSRYDLIYNRPNWRDIASKKPKGQTRKAYEQEREQFVESTPSQSLVSSEMRRVRDYHGGESEVRDRSGVKATHIHHIFPRSKFGTLQDVRENLIALTPGQHLGEAHPHGDTQKVDLVFQRVCLDRKLESVRRSVESADGMYCFKRFADVLRTGLGIEVVEADYGALRAAIIKLVL